MLSEAGSGIPVKDRGEFHISISLIPDPPCNHSDQETLCPLLSTKSPLININNRYKWPVLLPLLLWFINIAAEQCSHFWFPEQNWSFPDTLLWEAAHAGHIRWSGPGSRSFCEAIRDEKEYNSQISFSINRYLFLGEGWRVHLKE